MASLPDCVHCGEPLPPGEADCPYCAGRRRYPFLHSEPVLIAGIIALAIGLWIVTHGLTSAYETRQQHLAQEWEQRGQADLRNAQWRDAIDDLRTALGYSHDNWTVRLRLAQALAADSQIPQAQSYLRTLWDEQPGDGTINLELARLAVRTGNLYDAQRYYHGAIYGVWTESPMERRRQARIELINFLLQRQAFAQVESELIALSVDLPNDPALRTRVAGMFLKAGDPARALAEFKAVTRVQPRNAAALAGAGEAAFRLQDYRTARTYLSRAVNVNDSDTQSAELLNTTQLVLQLDPFQARIGQTERTRRIVRAMGEAQGRIEECADKLQIDLDAQPPSDAIATDYAQVLALKPRMKLSILRRDPDLADSAMDLVFRSEEDAAARCGAAEGPDLALILIGRMYQAQSRAAGGGGK